MKPVSAERAWASVRCPYCRRLAAEAVEGSVLRVKCGRCGGIFVREVAPVAAERGRGRTLTDSRG